MSSSNKKILFLQGLCCANCAIKIEQDVRKIHGVLDANINFATSLLSIELDNHNNFEDILNKTTKLIKDYEPDIIVKEKIIDIPKIEAKIIDFQIDRIEIFRFVISALLFITALFFSLPILVSFIIYVISYLLVGGKVLLKALRNILKGKVFDENFLMSVASLGAFALREFPEAVAVMLFYQIGEFFQDIAINRSRRSIAALMDIRPDFANLKVGNDIKKVSPEEIILGDIIIVKPGEKVPLDGIIIEGSSTLDTSALTGESLPRDVTVGNHILSGSINKNGLLTIEVSKTFGESTVSKILELVQNASSKKAPTEKFITKFAKYYTPGVVFAALFLALIPPIFISGAHFSEWINRALVFMVVSCPCALVVSIPLGFFGGIGGASKSGILIKGSNYLEALTHVETVVFDKTGTLTKGVFKVTKINNLMRDDGIDLLKYAALAETYSNHPIALSILDSYGKEIDKNIIENYEEISGLGVKVTVEGKTILAGNFAMMNREGITVFKAEEIGTILYIAIDGKYSGYIVISDEVKSDSKHAIKALKDMGVKTIVMLTGDNKFVGEKIGLELGIDEVHSELLPHEKVEKLELLESQKSSRGKLVFVGDGINDAPVLAMADIGVAMGGLGSDAAIEAADVVLMTDEPFKLVTAIKIARKTINIVRQNIFFAFGVKAIVLAFGAFGIATMWEAVFADVGVAILAIMNAMRVMKKIA